MKIRITFLIAIITALTTAFICYYLWHLDTHPDHVSPHYKSLLDANNNAETRKALDDLCNIEEYIGPVPVYVARQAFKSIIPEEDAPVDDYCWPVGHLAAISGDVELLRKMVYTYFGSAEGELKGGYIEEFLQYNPELFFSLPDTLELWNHAGGAQWCCDYPDLTIPIVHHFSFNTADAKRIFDDIIEEAKQMEGTEWSRNTKAVIDLIGE